MSNSPIKVLFVCLGNICRSPMAEAVMRHLVEKKGLVSQIEVDSAGTGDWHIGKPPHEGTRDLLTRYGIGFEGMKARQIAAEDLNAFNYIVCMDNSNYANVHAILEESGASANSQIIKLLDLLPDQPVREVPDPYYTGNFDEVYELVLAGCEKLITQITGDVR